MIKEGSVGEMIDNIVEVVLNTHYNYITSEELREDLIQEGYLKAYELLKIGTYDPRRNLRNYLYTGVRNAMQNFLYHDRKEVHSDLETAEIYVEAPEVVNIKVDLIKIKNMCDKYKSYGDYLPIALNYLKELNLYQGRIPEFHGTIDEVIQGAIKCEIIWSLVE